MDSHSLSFEIILHVYLGYVEGHSKQWRIQDFSDLRCPAWVGEADYLCGQLFLKKHENEKKLPRGGTSFQAPSPSQLMPKQTNS